jgi:LysR family transcriptional regulator, regulator for bpeEF and oprC
MMDNRPMLDLNALRDFVAVIREGSFTAAARALGVPKSTVSKRVQDLEASLSTRLIERTTRSLRLTPEGAAFHQRAVLIVAEADEAEASVHAQGQEPQGHLRIASPHLFGQTYLGGLAADYRARYPKVTLEFMLADRRVDLIEEGFDAAIRIGDLPSSSLIVRHLADADQVIVAAPSLLDRIKVPVQPAEFTTLPCLVYARGGASQVTWQLERANGGQNAKPVDVAIDPVVVLGSPIALREAAIAGAGIVMIPQFIAAAALAAGQLVEVLPDWRGRRIAISIVYPSARFLNARLRAFIELLAARFPGRLL